MAGQVTNDADGRSFNHEPAILIVVAGADFVSPPIGQRGLLAPQFDETFVPVQQLPVRLAVKLRPIEAGPQKSQPILRVGNFPGLPAEGGEFLATALANILRELQFVVIGEIKEWRRGAPFFTLEEHGHLRRRQHQRRSDLLAAKAKQLAGAVALRAVADLVVILEIRKKMVAVQPFRRPSMVPLAKRRITPVHDEHIAQRVAKIVQSPKIRVITASFAGQNAVKRVVKIITPLGVQAKSSALTGQDQPGIIQITFRDEHQAPAKLRFELFYFDAKLFEKR